MADSPYFDWSNFGTGAQPLYTGYKEWGGGDASAAPEQALMQGTTLFKQAFQNLLGRAPTADELGQFQSGALLDTFKSTGWSPTYGDVSGLANSYVQNQFGPQAAAYQQQQQTDQLGKSEQQLQGIVNQSMQNTASALTDPNSQIYQTLAGSMNNMGITPSSGAFQAGAGSTIANAGLNAANSGLQAIGIPGIQGIANTGTIPYQNSMTSGNTANSNIEGLNNFQLQSQLAQYLAQQSQPSGFQKDLGLAAGASQGFGNAAQGTAALSKMTWVCTAMWRAKILMATEVDRLHQHLFKAMFRRWWKFLGYFMFGKFLVLWAESKGVDWDDWKTSFYDRPMNEPDPLKALERYEHAFWGLFRWCYVADTKKELAR